MRLHRRSLLVYTVLAVAFLVAWTLQRLSVASLRAEVDALHGLNSDAEQLRRENGRLRQLQPKPEELVILQKAADEYAKLEHEVSSRAKPRPAPTSFEAGRAVLAKDWKARGQDTPSAAIETLLVAAASGDLASLQPLLQLDLDAHARAAAFLARLPAASRALYSSPEQLIAALTVKNIPLGSAQVAWHEENKPGFAEALVYLRELPPSPSASSPLDMKIIKTVHLNFQHGPGGWRIIVPLSAIEKIERELTH